MDNNKKDTVIAFTRLLCMAVTSGLAMLGFAADADLVYNVVTVALFVAATLWGWWKDNCVTTAASEAHEFYQIIKTSVPRCDMVGDDDGDEA